MSRAQPKFSPRRIVRFELAGRVRLAASASRGSQRRAERALDCFARERCQGRGPKGGSEMSPIIEHPDVQRMLMTMKAMVHAARGVCHLTAASLDLASHGRTEKERAEGADRAALLTPIAKAFSTDIGDEAASLGIQVHGGMGFIEDTGAAKPSAGPRTGSRKRRKPWSWRRDRCWAGSGPHPTRRSPARRHIYACSE